MQYEYTPERKVEKIRVEPDHSVITFSYGDSRINVSSDIILFLDSDGRVYHEEKIATSTDPHIYVTHYKYDAAGHCIFKETSGSAGPTDTDTLFCHYSNGNLDSIERTYYSYGFKTIRQYFTYYPGDTNSLSNAARGQPFMGLSSRNALESVRMKNILGEDSILWSYFYVFDERGRIVRQVKVIPGKPNDTVWFEYF